VVRVEAFHHWPPLTRDLVVEQRAGDVGHTGRSKHAIPLPQRFASPRTSTRSVKASGLISRVGRSGGCAGDLIGHGLETHRSPDGASGSIRQLRLPTQGSRRAKDDPGKGLARRLVNSKHGPRAKAPAFFLCSFNERRRRPLHRRSDTNAQPTEAGTAARPLRAPFYEGYLSPIIPLSPPRQLLIRPPTDAG
jgi:hypothetical protein